MRPIEPGTFDRGERGERYDRNNRGEWNQFRQVSGGQQGSRGGGGANSTDRFRNRTSASAQVRTLAPTGTAPADVERGTPTALITADRPVVTGSLYQPVQTTQSTAVVESDDDKRQLMLKTLRVYPFGVNRDRLAESARQLRVPIILTNREDEADAVITLKNYYKRQPERLQQAEQEQKLIIILKNNTVAQMQHALAHIFDIPEVDPARDDEDESGEGSGSDDDTTRALLETEDAIHQLLNKGLTTAELAPANAYVRRLQHQMATRYNLNSRSRGKEPYRRVKIFRTRE